MAEAIAFYVLAAFILGFGVLVVTSTNPVHSIVFLVLDFLSVAGLYVTLGAEFVAAIQVLVYAGGIVVLYLFVVMLVNVKRAPEAYGPRRRHSMLGMALAGAVLLELAAIASLVGRASGGAGGCRCGGAGQRQHRAGRLAALYQLPDSVRDCVDAAARRHGRRHRARQEGDLSSMISSTHYLMLSAALFTIGLIGVMTRRNIIIVFMSIELMLNAVNINLVASSKDLHNLVGQVFAVFVIAVAAAEAAVGLGIILAFYRNKETVNIDEMNIMRW